MYSGPKGKTVETFSLELPLDKTIFAKDKACKNFVTKKKYVRQKEINHKENKQSDTKNAYLHAILTQVGHK